jgi:PPOX class probable F420-dependent enzyme
MPTTIHPATPEGARALASLANDKTGWITTVDASGQPQSSPIWFLWDGGEILVYSHRAARRNADVAERPRVSFNLNTDASGDELVTMEGTVRVDHDGPDAAANPAYLAKYEPHILAYGWTAGWFAAEYPVALRITPTRWRLG